MTDGIKSTLDSCATFAKDHHVLVQSFELFVASVSLLSMIPCLIVIAKTGTLHFNCKLLLISSATVQMQLITVQITNVFYEFYTGLHLPDDMSETSFIMFIHEIGYGISTIVSVYLVVERFVALWNATTYSESIASWNSIIFMALFAICFAIPWAYYSDIEGHFYIGIGIILSIELPMNVFSFILHMHSRKKYRRMNECPLSVRYQLAEILEYSRAVIPVVVYSSIVKSCSLITCVLWQEGLGQYGLMRVLFFTIHSLNCVAMKTLLILSHRGLRRTFLIYFSWGEYKSEHRVAPREETINVETETYFRYLKTMWD